MELIVSKAKSVKIPVFTSIPTSGVSGALFELGADYPAIGKIAGNLAADVLDGRDPARIPVENIMPVSLRINKLALKDLREQWKFPDDAVKNANVVIDETGVHANNAPAPLAAANSSAASGASSK